MDKTSKQIGTVYMCASGFGVPAEQITFGYHESRNMDEFIAASAAVMVLYKLVKDYYGH